MSYALGTATGTIKLDYDGKGVEKAKDDIDGLKDQSKKAGLSIDDMGKKASIAGVAIAAGLGLGVKTAADFEQRMSAVGAVSGATGAELDALKDKALQLGKETAFSAGESAKAMEELAKAGISVTEILNGAADSTVALAAAGEVDMASAAAIMSASMNSYGIAAQDSARVADLLAGTANSTATTVEDLGMAIRNVGPIASATGVSIEDTTTALGLLAKTGISGAKAGTALMATLRQLNPQSKVAQKELKKLGIITKDGSNQFFDAQGNMKSMSEVSQILQDSTKGLTAQQKQLALSTIFGTEGFAGANALAKAGAKDFDKLGKSIGEVKAADVAAARMDNFKGSLEEMMGSLETLGIALGTVLLPALRKIVDGVTKLLNVFLNLPSGVQAGIVAFLAIIAASLLALSAFVKMVAFLKAVKAAFIAVRAVAIPAWLAALGPIALVIVAIAAVVAIIVLLWKKSETFQKIVKKVWSGIQKSVSAVADWFKQLPGIFDAAWEGIKSGMQAVLNFIKSNWRVIITLLLGPLGLAIALITKYWDQIKAVFFGAINAIKAVWEGFWGTFGPLITAVWELIKAIITLGMKLILFAIGAWLIAVKAVFSRVWNAIAAVVRMVWGIISRIVMTYINIVRAVVSRVFNVIKGITSSVWGAISGVIKRVWGVISGIVSSQINRVKSIMSSVWNAIKSAVSTMWNAIVNTVGDKIDDLLEKVKNIKDSVVDFFADAGTWLLDAGKAIMKGLLDGITDGVSAVTSKLESVTKLIPDWKGPPKKDKVLLEPAGQMIMEGLINGVADMIRPFANQLGDVTDMIPGTVEGPVVAATPFPPGRVRKPGGSGRPRSRILSGELDLSPSGRAFIRGVAEDTYDDNEDFDDAHGRMG